MTSREDETVGGVVLAAGESTRFESGNKLLEPVDGAPLIRHVATTASESALDDIVAILGYEADAVDDALEGLSLSTRYNEDYEDGQSTSVRRGIAYARDADWDAAVFLLGDMPFVQPETVSDIVTHYREHDGSIVAPRYEGKRGNPVLFAKDHFDTLADVTGDRGGRELIMEHDGTKFLETDDQGVLQDIDSEADLEKYTT